jgi:hypothetical protein
LFVLVSRRFHMEARPHCSKGPTFCLRLLIASCCARSPRDIGDICFVIDQDSSISKMCIILTNKLLNIVLL